LNVAVQVPVNAVTDSEDCSLNVSCKVPLPEIASLIEPDQLPAGETSASVGDVAAAVSPPQPAALRITAMTRGSHRFI
jgi:hypothetical protein